ncbi:WD40 repeat domain-containing protein [Verrucomicrobium spinosum]|uniref:WD40 repeat domain-containing protein n=1 Tax=Verrucomicrobium spinosum TaxID=2736 RepID=UPI00155DC55A|nr:WD40 repeat domain-containing protein [Verrucomicrobium spinosum]
MYRTASGAPASPSIFSPLPIWCARFSPDGHLIATGSAPVRPRPASYAEINVSSNPLRGEARLWRSATGRQTGRTLHHEGPVNSLLFSPDGTRLLTASQDKTSRIWSVPDGHPVGDIMLHDHPVNDLSLDAGGKILLTGSGVSQSEKVQQAGALRLWDPLTGKPASPVMETHSLTRKVRLAPGGETWLTLVGGSANNAESQYSLWFPQKARRGFVPLPLKKRIRSALWTTPEKGTWRGDYVTSFGYGGWDSWSYSGSGSYYSYSYDYYYRLSVAPHSEPCPLSYHPKESSIATLQEGGLSFWSTTDGRAIGPRVLITSASRDTPSVCYSPDGRWLATAGGKCGMRLWDVGTTGVLAPQKTCK